MNYNDMSEEEQIAAVERESYDIQFIKNPSETVQLAAVQQDGMAIQFIKNPSETVQLAAVEQDGFAIYHIKNPSETVQMAAVQKDGLAIEYIRNPSERVQLAAVQQDDGAIYLIDNPSETVKAAAAAAKRKNADARKRFTPPPGSWAATAAMMASLFPDEDFDWDAWKDQMKDAEAERGSDPKTRAEAFDRLVEKVINEAFSYSDSEFSDGDELLGSTNMPWGFGHSDRSEQDWNKTVHLRSFADDYSAELSFPAFVTAYDLTQRYGGPEEGGWYYDAYQGLESVEVNSAEEAEQAAKKLYDQYKGRTDGRLNIKIERKQYSRERERPQYS